MPTDSQILAASAPNPGTGPGSTVLADREEELLAEIERLRMEVGRLNRKLVEERADRAVQEQVHTVLSSLHCSPTIGPGEARAPGVRLNDGRYMPEPITVGGTARPPEPGAPRVPAAATAAPTATAAMTAPPAETGERRPNEESYEFAPGDDSATAFDEFFNVPDPHLDKIRRFLLD